MTNVVIVKPSLSTKLALGVSLVFASATLCAMDENLFEKDQIVHIVKEPSKSCPFQFEKFSGWLASQNYKEALSHIRSTVNDSLWPQAADALYQNAYKKFHVPLMFESFRNFIHVTQYNAPQSGYLKCQLAWVLVALVLTKADVDCCLKLAHLKLNQKDTHPYDLLLKNYNHRLGQRPTYTESIPYKEALLLAQNFFKFNITQEWNKESFTLPLPVWVTKVYNSSWWSTWLDFDNPAEHVRDTYKDTNVQTLVSSVRCESYEKTWKIFSKCQDWASFFKISAQSIEAGELNVNEAPLEVIVDTQKSENQSSSTIENEITEKKEFNEEN